MKKIDVLSSEIKDGIYDDRFSALYGSQDAAEKEKERYLSLLENFKNKFGDLEVEVYSAPGRSEIGGNHTDHQHGKVLACSVNLDAVAVVSKREDNIIEIISEGFNIKPVKIDNLEPEKNQEGTTEALIKGVCSGFAQRGYKVGGFSAYMNSTVLGGSGLSSSAAFEVLMGTILSGIYNECEVGSIEIAQIGQYAENVYFGKPCGLLDQMTSSVGGFVYMDFENPKRPIVKKLDYNFENSGHSLCIIDTGGSHADLTDEYASIPLEMKVVSSFFGKKVLRECDENEFYKNIKEIRKLSGDRAILRACHIFEENKRVDKQSEALLNNDFDEFKKLIIESGNSSYMMLQNVFAANDAREQGLSLALSISKLLLDGKGAWRVHGGGFAGTIQSFVPNDYVADYRKNMEEIFGENCFYSLKVRPFGGIKVI